MRYEELVSHENGLSELDEAYFRAHGYLPPAVSPDVTVEELERAIEERDDLASRATDPELSEQLTYEAGYLSERLRDLKNGR